MDYKTIPCTNRKNWLEQRRKGIGASDVAAILGECPFRSAMEIYESKVSDSIEDAQLERFYWGHAMEQPIRDRFNDDPPDDLPDGYWSRNTGDFTIYQSKSKPWAQCTPDGLIHPEKSPSPPEGNHQIKNSSQFAGHNWDEGIPIHTRLQVQYEMFVLGVEFSYVSVLIGGCQYKCFREDRKQNVIDWMIPKLENFWSMVQAMKEPEIDESESCAKALARLHPDDNGETVALDAHYADVFDAIKQNDADIAKAKEGTTSLKNQLRKALGDASFGALADGRSFSWKSQDRKGHVVKPSTFRVLRLHKAKK